MGLGAATLPPRLLRALREDGTRLPRAAARAPSPRSSATVEAVSAPSVSMQRRQLWSALPGPGNAALPAALPAVVVVEAVPATGDAPARVVVQPAPSEDAPAPSSPPAGDASAPSAVVAPEPPAAAVDAGSGRAALWLGAIGAAGLALLAAVAVVRRSPKRRRR